MPKAARTRTAASTRKRALTDLRRAEIIAAALKVFARKGFHDARAEDVAAAAHIAKGTLYLYFESKEAIYEAALQHAMARLSAIVSERVQNAVGVRAQVHAYVSTRLEFWGEQGDLYRMILTLGRERRYRRHTATLLRASVDALTTILGAAVDQGELSKRPMLPIGWATMDLIRGAVERRIDGTDVLATPEEAQFITDTVLRYFAPVAERRR